MSKLALIDIGSNSIRMVLYRVDQYQVVQELQRYRQFVQLAKDMTTQGAINQNNFAAGIQTLKKFHQIIKEHKVNQVIATATEAIRQASNQADFIHEASAQAHIDIVVLSGQQEAQYDALAIQNDLSLSDFLFLDTGGGSFELGAVQQNKLQQAGSWPYGAVKLYDDLKAPTQLTSLQIKQVQTKLNSCIQTIQKYDISQLVVIGGVHRTLFALMDQPAGSWLSTSQIEDWLDTLQHNSLSQNLEIKHMESQRAPFMPAGLLPLKTVLDYFNIQEVCFSKAGLRNGILSEYLAQNSLEHSKKVLF